MPSTPNAYTDQKPIFLLDTCNQKQFNYPKPVNGALREAKERNGNIGSGKSTPQFASPTYISTIPPGQLYAFLSHFIDPDPRLL